MVSPGTLFLVAAMIAVAINYLISIFSGISYLVSKNNSEISVSTTVSFSLSTLGLIWMIMRLTDTIELQASPMNYREFNSSCALAIFLSLIAIFLGFIGKGSKKPAIIYAAIVLILAIIGFFIVLSLI